MQDLQMINICKSPVEEGAEGGGNKADLGCAQFEKALRSLTLLTSLTLMSVDPANFLFNSAETSWTHLR
jgi:hypothetical protein